MPRNTTRTIGTGLIPKSAPMIEEIAEFWGCYYLGPGMEEEGGSVAPVSIVTEAILQPAIPFVLTPPAG